MRLPVRCLEIASIERSLSEMERMGADAAGLRSLASKQLHYNLKVEGLTGPEAEILRDSAAPAGALSAVFGPEAGAALVSGALEGFRLLIGRLEKTPGASRVADSLASALDNYRKDEFSLAGRCDGLKVGPSTLIMGILNVTPDSFSDGGLFFDPARAVERALEMSAEGADWIDIGGESTRPGAEPVSLKDELERVIPVVRAVASKGLTVSIDTTKAEVAKEALEAGARIVNDVSALGADPEMAGVCARFGAAVVLMHMRGTPKTMQKDVGYSDIVSEVYGYLASRVEFAVSSGIARDNIIIDPGIGFGKSVEGNLRLLRDLKEFKSLGAPILVGASRKSFLGKVTGADVSGRAAGSVAAEVVSILNGANIVRVHDIKEAREAAQIADAVKRG